MPKEGQQQPGLALPPGLRAGCRVLRRRIRAGQGQPGAERQQHRQGPERQALGPAPLLARGAAVAAATAAPPMMPVV